MFDGRPMSNGLPNSNHYVELNERPSAEMKDRPVAGQMSLTYPSVQHDKQTRHFLFTAQMSTKPASCVGSSTVEDHGRP